MTEPTPDHDHDDSPRTPFEAILAAASTRRAPGASSRRVEAIDPVAAYVRIHEELQRTLGGLDDDAFGAEVTPYGWTVTQLVAHLSVIDDYLAGVLGVRRQTTDPITALDHLEMTRAEVERWTAGPAATVSAWQTSSRAVIDALRGCSPDDLRRRVQFHQLNTRISTILDVRLFELWTHHEDILRAIGRPPAAVDPALLHRMARVAVPAIPLGLLGAGTDLGDRTVRFVLTGPGGGTFDQVLRWGAEPGEAELVIVAEVAEFCRLAGRRLEPDQLDCEIEGDAVFALDVLHGAANFAA